MVLESHGIRGRGTHRRGLGGPAGWTHLTVGLHKLEGLHQAQRLFYTAAHWEVVHTHVSHHAVWIDEKQASEGPKQFIKNTSVVLKNKNDDQMYTRIKKMKTVIRNVWITQSYTVTARK